MSKVDLAYVKFVLSSVPTATIIKNLSTEEFSLIWEEDGKTKFYYLETVGRDRQKPAENFWRKMIADSQMKVEESMIDKEEMPEEVKLFLKQTFDKKRK